MTRVIADGESSKGSSAQGDDKFFSGSQDLGSMDSPQYQQVAAATGVSAAAMASAASSGPNGASPAPSTGSGPRVGISTTEMTPSSHSQSSKSGKSRDWSLSDTDLRELLEQGNSLADLSSSSLATPVALAGAGPLGTNLSPVPETQAAVGGDPLPYDPVQTRLATERTTVLSSPSSHSHSSAATSAATTSCDTIGSSPPRSMVGRSVPGTSSASPAQSNTSRTQTTVHSSPPQSTGTTSNSLITNWSSATRSSAAVRNSATQSSPATQSGSGTQSTSIVSPVTNLANNVREDDILEEASINSNFSDLL